MCIYYISEVERWLNKNLIKSLSTIPVIFIKRKQLGYISHQDILLQHP